MRVTTTYLEQTSPADLRPATEPLEPVTVARVPLPDAELNRALYAGVGADWQWTDRAAWSLEQWRGRLDRPGGETWVARVGDEPAGYAELETVVTDSGSEVEVVYFGLLPAFTGRGLGGHVLSVAARQAWLLHERWPALPPVRRVWLHTCSLDGPAALPNYLARGFRPYRTTQAEQPG